MEADEIEETVLQLYKEGRNMGEIGVILRDQYGVPNIKLACDKSVKEILKENDVYPDVPEDLRHLMERAVELKEHLDKHPKDEKNKRGMQLIESKIRRLAEYYRENNELDEDWRYSIDDAEIMTQ